jgi:regulator of protease activity HflC (stomatin/prohibitin superfamily)
LSRGYGADKRQREDQRQKKQAEKARRRQERREVGPGQVPIEQGDAAQYGASPSVDEIMARMDTRGSGESRSAAAIPARLFVGGLAREVTDQQLRAAFAAVGPVIDAVVMRDRESGEPRGFGFVTMQDRKDAPKAISQLHGTDLMGRNLVVNVATDRPR